MERPLVSIITPSYNSEKFIADTILSVQGQTWPHWEMIIVDDFSADKTLELAREFAVRDNRIKLIELGVNSGAAIARNHAIAIARGKYLAFLDSDDLWLPTFIQESVNAIKTTGIPFVCASYRRADEELNFNYPDFIVPKKATYFDILKTNSIGCLTAFLDIEALGKKTMPEIHKRQDMGLWLKYLKEIPFVHGIQEPLAIYRVRKNSLSQKNFALVQSQWQFYRKVEQLTFFQSCYYMLHWMWNGFFKHRH